MCSIEGTTDKRFNVEVFCQHNLSRGPDGTNTYIGRDIQFGHNLLKISPNQKNIPQPFVTDKGNVLCYNGEIYGLKDNVFDTEWLADRIENDVYNLDNYYGEDGEGDWGDGDERF